MVDMVESGAQGQNYELIVKVEKQGSMREYSSDGRGLRVKATKTAASGDPTVTIYLKERFGIIIYRNLTNLGGFERTGRRSDGLQGVLGRAGHRFYC